MASDPNQPAQKPTVQFDAVPPWAISLTQRVTSGLASMEEHLTQQDSALSTLAANDLTASARMQKFEIRLDAIEERQTKNSTGTRALSQSDLAQEAQLADIIVWRKTVATKDDLKMTTLAQTTQLFARFDELKKKPLVRYALAVAGTAITTWLASKGFHLP